MRACVRTYDTPRGTGTLGPIAFGQLAPAGRIHAARLMALLPLTHGDARVLRRRVCYSGAGRVRVRVRVSYSGAAAEGRGRDGRDGEAR